MLAAVEEEVTRISGRLPSLTSEHVMELTKECHEELIPRPASVGAGNDVPTSAGRWGKKAGGS